MRFRSLAPLLLLIAAASCVPPGGGARQVTVALAEPLPIAASRFVSPGPWLPGMPQPLAPAPIATAALPMMVAASPFAPVAQAPEDAGRALDCLTAAVYYEARSESIDGQRAVAQVVLNRVRNPAFPNSICGVVYQGSNRATGCQFSFTCDGSLLARREPEAWDRAQLVARAALAGDVYAPVGPATFYHTTAILPWWAPSLTRVAQIGAHIFYRWPGLWSPDQAFRQAYAGVEQAPGAAPGDAGDPADAIRFAIGDGQFVTIHRGGRATSVTAAASHDGVEAMPGIRVHYGPGGGTATEPSFASDGSVRIHSGNAPGTSAAESAAEQAAAVDQPNRPVT